jgi:hypothetical protein
LERFNQLVQALAPQFVEGIDVQMVLAGWHIVWNASIAVFIEFGDALEEKNGKPRSKARATCWRLLWFQAGYTQIHWKTRRKKHVLL